MRYQASLVLGLVLVTVSLSQAFAQESGQPLSFSLSVSAEKVINGGNGVCMSNIIKIPGPSVADSRSRSVKEDELIMPYASSFLLKCQALVPAKGPVTWGTDGSPHDKGRFLASHQDWWGRPYVVRVLISP